MLSGESWAGSTAKHELYTQADLPKLGVLLRTLDASNTVTAINVYKTVAVPHLTSIGKVCRNELKILDGEITKLL